MALETTDVFPVQKTDGGSGSVRKATIGALLNMATDAVVSFWERNGTVLSPATDGDSIEGISNITLSGDITAGGDIQAVNATFSGTLEADNIDGGEYAV